MPYRVVMADVVPAEGADFGVAFDVCYFFDRAEVDEVHDC